MKESERLSRELAALQKQEEELRKKIKAADIKEQLFEDLRHDLLEVLKNYDIGSPHSTTEDHIAQALTELIFGIENPDNSARIDIFLSARNMGEITGEITYIPRSKK
jgi:SMC interacting uncharacterized protein involved in chromosome segregation